MANVPLHTNGKPSVCSALSKPLLSPKSFTLSLFSSSCETEINAFLSLGEKLVKAIVHDRWCVLQAAVKGSCFYAALPNSRLWLKTVCEFVLSLLPVHKKKSHVVDLKSSLMQKSTDVRCVKIVHFFEFMLHPLLWNRHWSQNVIWKNVERIRSEDYHQSGRVEKLQSSLMHLNSERHPYSHKLFSLNSVWNV